MKPKISLITLGVADLERSKKFYQDLGLPLDSNSNDDVAFFSLDGTWLGLYPADKLADDATVDQSGSGFRSFTLAHNVGSEAEVEEMMAVAVTHGATIVKAPQKVFWGGFSGYFSDPDGFLWEVAYNPFMDLT